MTHFVVYRLHNLEFSTAVADGTNSSNTFSLLSFVTPDKKFHKMLSYVENGIRIPYIDISGGERHSIDVKIKNIKMFTYSCSAKRSS